MTKPVQTIDQVDTINKPVKPNPLSTTLLTSTDLETQSPETNLDTTNWLALLMPQPTLTESQPTPPPQPQPQSSGMTEHRTPPRMTPTIGSRLTTGLRRTILLTSLAVLAAATLTAGAYVISSTTWLSTLLSPSAPPPAQQPAPTTNQPPTGSTGSTTQPQPQPPANTTAIQLRDKGIQQYKAGNFNASIDLLQNSVNLAGTDAVTYYQLGLSYMAAPGRDHALDDAEMAFRTAISLQPTWAAPHQLLAESLLRQGFYQDAITPALEATKLDPTQSDAWLTLGRAYQGAGQQPQAAQAFAQATRHAPKAP